MLLQINMFIVLEQMPFAKAQPQDLTQPRGELPTALSNRLRRRTNKTKLTYLQFIYKSVVLLFKLLAWPSTNCGHARRDRNFPTPRLILQFDSAHYATLGSYETRTKFKILSIP
jgi:hypothetical protein